MTWVLTAGAVIGGGLGYMGARETANATRDANEANLEPWRMVKPYMADYYNDLSAGYNRYRDAGTYTGDTYAGMDPATKAGYNYISGAGASFTPIAGDLVSSGSTYGSNAADLYGGIPTAAENLKNASDFANANYGGLLDAEMRDDQRNYEENVLTGIDQAAAATGNTNNTRSAVQKAIAERALLDRKSDMSNEIKKDLRREYLTNEDARFRRKMDANTMLGGALTTGVDLTGTSGDFMVNSGNAFQDDRQKRLDAERERYEREAGFDYNLASNYGGVLNNNSPSPFAPMQPNTTSPMAAGFGGAMTGAGTAMGLQDYLSRAPRYGGGGGFTMAQRRNNPYLYQNHLLTNYFGVQ